MSQCSEYVRLAAEVEELLKDLTEKTILQLEVFRSKDEESFKRVDKELENLVGAKERAIGALRQHSKDHQCQAAFSRV